MFNERHGITLSCYKKKTPVKLICKFSQENLLAREAVQIL
jgi:hypothetical protein